MDKIGMPSLPNSKTGSFIGNSSFLASYILFNLYFAIYALFSLKKKKAKLLFFNKSHDLYNAFLTIGILIMTLALMFSDGRAAIISFFGGLLLLFLLWWALRIKKRKLRFLGKVMLSIFIISFLIIVSLLLTPNSRIQQKFGEVGGRARPMIWGEAWNAFLERPILGWGPETFIISSNRYFDSSLFLLGEYNHDRAHNIIFDNLLDAGILGLISYLSIFISAFYLLWRSYSKKRINFWATAIPTVLILAHFTKNLSVFDMPSGYLMLIFLFLFISLTTSQEPKNNKVVIRNKKNHFIFPAIFLLLIMFVSSLYFFIQKPASANIGAAKVLRSKKYNKQAYKQALNSSWIGKYQIGVCIADSMVSMAKDKSRELSLEEIRLIEKTMEQNIRSSRLDYYSHLFLGQIYNIHGFTFEKSKFNNAEKILRQAIILSPTHPIAYWELAKTKIYLGKNKEAVILAKKVIDLEPELLNAHVFLINLYRNISEDKAAEQAIKKAIKIIPDIVTELEDFINIQEL
ncbi:MAG: O-antigen ligase family protein [Patescibacteria group bacterium]|nr:O-antigen ligase family protein [Patescibacteria group bacterium]